MDRGQVLEQQVVVNVDEPVYVINIKRAIVSQLQLPIPVSYTHLTLPTSVYV